MNKQQLAARIWRLANQMRSKIEASEYKDYILGFVFYKFLSQQEVSFLKANAWDDEDIAELSENDANDVEFIQNNLGYFISYDNLFSTWLAKKGDFDISNVRDALSAFKRLVKKDYEAVYSDIFTTLDTGLSKLGDNAAKQTKAVADIIKLIDPIPMDGREDYDVLGYIYEYLISQFAANAGKKAGEFYTPHEVAILMSDIIASHFKGKSEIDIYDPTSGSASLLITIGQSVARQNGNPEAIHYYAQELKSNTYNLTRMNLVMRGIRPANITAKNADTLADDWPMTLDADGNETDKPLLVDACVSNPPYSQKWTLPTGPDPRFDEYGIAPKGKADYAFLLHNLYHLRRDGIMTIVLPHGVLFRGDAEGEIRRKLLDEGHIYAIIGLPPNIFYGTGIPTIVMVLKKVRSSRDVLFIDASHGFVKDSKKNKLRQRDIRRIVDAYELHKDIPGFAHVAELSEIAANDYNLNIPRYVDSGSAAEPVDLYATMFGGIPSAELDGLSGYWDALPGLRDALFAESDGYATPKVGDISAAIGSHGSVAAWRGSFAQTFDGFSDGLASSLLSDVCAVDGLSLREEVVPDIFFRCSRVPLIDGYEAYQILDDHWSVIETDLEAIGADGLDALRAVDANMVPVTKEGHEDEEAQDKKVPWVGRVIPFDIAQERYFADVLDAIGAADGRVSAIDSELEGMLSDMDEDELQGSFCDDDGAKWDFKALPSAIDEELGVYSDDLAALTGYRDLLAAGSSARDLAEYTSKHPLGNWSAMRAKSDGTYTKAAINKRIAAVREGIDVESGSLAERLMKVQGLHDEQAAKKKEAKELRAALIVDTKARIEALSDDEAIALLRVKWVDSLIDDLNRIPEEVLSDFSKRVSQLIDKYSTTLSEVGEQIESESAALVKLLGQLTGNDKDMAGVRELIELLGGE